jgi:hypothetical protein
MGNMKLVDNVIRSMRVGKVFRDNQEGINHLHFSTDGASLISSSDDDQVETKQQQTKMLAHCRFLAGRRLNKLYHSLLSVN